MKNWFKPIPKDLKEAVARLHENLLDEDKKYLKENGSAQFHHGLGRHLRNEWKLWQKNTILNKWFWDTHKIWHADDISSIILDYLAEILNGRYLNVDEEVKRYHNHWLEVSKIKPGERPKDE